ncbi:MAG: hypothetical protein GY732_13790 [Gammaproteobacteria bacterium]|nr:hypothetical protein [Gammaproteobacteria bacterium]
MVVGTLSLAGALGEGSVLQYAQLAVMGLMVVQVMTGFALLRLPTKLPDIYQSSPFKLKPLFLYSIGICYIIFSLVFLFVLASEQTEAILPGLLLIALGLATYFVSSFLRGRIKQSR